MTWDLRCTLPAHGYQTGQCHGLLFKVTSTGGLEVKCHRCHQIQMIHRPVLEQYRVADRLDYATEG